LLLEKVEQIFHSDYHFPQRAVTAFFSLTLASHGDLIEWFRRLCISANRSQSCGES
jgi:hypothetical protein